MPAIIHKSSLKQGIASSAPITVAFAFIFFSLGIIAHSKGFNLLETMLLSSTVFAGPSQIYVMTHQTESLWAIGLNIFLLNFKFLLMATVMISLWDKQRKLTIPPLAILSNTTYLVTVVQKNCPDIWSFYLGLAITGYFTALIATIIGHFAWHAPDAIREFFTNLAHMVIPIHFVCLTLKRREHVFTIIASLLGFLGASALPHIIHKNCTILVWMIIAGLFVFIERKPNAS